MPVRGRGRFETTRGIVPIPINFNEVEIGAILATINQKKIKVRIDLKFTAGDSETLRKTLT